MDVPQQQILLLSLLLILLLILFLSLLLSLWLSLLWILPLIILLSLLLSLPLSPWFAAESETELFQYMYWSPELLWGKVHEMSM